MADPTIADRLRWVLTSKGLSAHGLSVKAGLAGGHVGLILRGDISGNVQVETMRAIAKAADVSENWLSTGEGSPDDRPGAPPSAPPDRARPTMGELPTWPVLLSGAKAKRPNTEAWVWEKTAEAHPMLSGPATVAMVLAIAVRGRCLAGRLNQPRPQESRGREENDGGDC